MADFSTYIQITNNTNFEFQKISEDTILGDWKISPPGVIAPNSSSVNFVLEDSPGDMYGSRGKLSYAFGDTILDMTFGDPSSDDSNYVTLNIRRDTVLSDQYEITTWFQTQTNGGAWYRNYVQQSGHPLSINYRIDAKYPRPATDAEYQRQILTTPKINRQIFRYLSDEDSSYSSCSWSLGIGYVWINLPSTTKATIQMYANAGEVTHSTSAGIKWKSNCNYVLTDTLANGADVDLMCRTKEEGKLKPMHAIRKYQDAYYNPEPVSTSKFGIHRLAKHARENLQGKFYGDITHSFVKHYVPPPPPPPSVENNSNNSDVPPPPPPPSVENNSNNSDVNQTLESASVIYKDFHEVYQARHLAIMNTPVDVRQMEKLNDIIQNCDTAFRACFEERYACWKRECANMYSSNTYDYVFLHSFRNLAVMGTGIIPLVVKKMSLEQNFHDLPLYESLQQNKLLCVSQHSANAEDSLPLESEQSRARRTVHRYLQYLP